MKKVSIAFRQINDCYDVKAPTESDDEVVESQSPFGKSTIVTD